MAIAYFSTAPSQAGPSGSAAVGNSTVDFGMAADPKLFSILIIHVSAQDLKPISFGADIDPVCALLIPLGDGETEVSRTEVVQGKRNPAWVRAFQAAYIFKQKQPLHFVVYDASSDNSLVGECTIAVHELCSRIRDLTTLPLTGASGDPGGSLILTVEESRGSQSNLKGTFSFADLPKMRTFSKNCPYFVFSREVTPGNFINSYQSESAHKLSTGTWSAFEIPLQFLVAGDVSSPLFVIVMDDLGKKSPVEIGRVETTVNDLLAASESGAELILSGKAKKSPAKLRFKGELVRRITFIDYLRNGLSLDLITAIDYTGSNGDSRNASSLHHIAPDKQNVYERCIDLVAGTVGIYDSDQRFLVYGFGGEFRGQVSHCFPVNGNEQDPSVSGLSGILQAYHQSLTRVKLSGPTWFGPVIRRAIQAAEVAWESKIYTVLLIITDGSIQDMSVTIDAVVDACEKALSIVIVGVGSADFSSMKTLDADEVKLKSSKGVIANRDIVQFVQYSLFDGLPPGERELRIQAAILEEIPAQVHKFCSEHGFRPEIA